jgi:hypothetical protein
MPGTLVDVQKEDLTRDDDHHAVYLFSSWRYLQEPGLSLFFEIEGFW